MRALVTGGAGFIGSHLVEELLARGDEVVALDDLSTGSLSNVQGLQGERRFRFVLGSVLDGERLTPLVEASDVVFHLAAAVGVRYVLEHPLTALETNARGSENVLQAASLSGKKVVITSSSEVYGKSAQVPLREDSDTLLGPTSVRRWGYACSKAFDEFLALAYHQEKRLPVVVLRLFNTVGPRQTDRYGMVLPRFVKWALAGEPIRVYGDGEQTRCFTWVKDVVRAMADISRVPSAEGEVFNVGSNAEITINRLAELVRDVLGSRSQVVHVPFREAFGEGFEETRRRVPDVSKVQRYIQFRPRADLSQIVLEIAGSISGAGTSAVAKESYGKTG